MKKFSEQVLSPHKHMSKKASPHHAHSMGLVYTPRGKEEVRPIDTADAGYGGEAVADAQGGEANPGKASKKAVPPMKMQTLVKANEETERDRLRKLRSWAWKQARMGLGSDYHAALGGSEIYRKDLGGKRRPVMESEGNRAQISQALDRAKIGHTWKDSETLLVHDKHVQHVQSQLDKHVLPATGVAYHVVGHSQFDEEAGQANKPKSSGAFWIQSDDKIGNTHYIRRTADGRLFSHNQNGIVLGLSNHAFFHPGGHVDKQRAVKRTLHTATNSEHAAKLMNASKLGQSNWKPAAHDGDPSSWKYTNEEVKEDVEQVDETSKKKEALDQGTPVSNTGVKLKSRSVFPKGSAEEREAAAAFERAFNKKAKGEYYYHEEAEQVDEVSKAMLRTGYLPKARDSLETHSNYSYRYHDMYDMDDTHPDEMPDNEDDREDERKAANRERGIARARSKINKTGTARVKATESVQIDEVKRFSTAYKVEPKPSPIFKGSSPNPKVSHFSISRGNKEVGWLEHNREAGTVTGSLHGKRIDISRHKGDTVSDKFKASQTQRIGRLRKVLGRTPSRQVEEGVESVNEAYKVGSMIQVGTDAQGFKKGQKLKVIGHDRQPTPAGDVVTHYVEDEAGKRYKLANAHVLAKPVSEANTTITRKQAAEILGGPVRPKSSIIGGPGQPKNARNLASRLAVRSMKAGRGVRSPIPRAPVSEERKSKVPRIGPMEKALEEGEVWDGPMPDSKKRGSLSPEQKAKARARANKAGRSYPNMIDNMWASKQ